MTQPLSERELLLAIVAESLKDPDLRAARIAQYGRGVYFPWDETYRIADDGSLVLQPQDPARAFERNVFCAPCGVVHLWMGECPVAALDPAHCLSCGATYYSAAAIVEHLRAGCGEPVL
jgi:hypothetical protein